MGILDDIEDYKEPVLPDSDQYTVRDKDGHVVIVKVMEFRPDMQLENGKKDAIIAHFCDLNEKNEDGKVGKIYAYTVQGQGAVVDGLKPLLDKKGKGVVTFAKCVTKSAKNGGRKYGSLGKLDDETKAKVRRWLEKNGDPFGDIPEARSYDDAVQAAASGGLDDFDDTPAGGSASGDDDAAF